MKRKIVKQGHNAMTLTLPISWIKEQNISAGDELDVEQKGKDLIIRREHSGIVDKTTFSMHGKGKFIHRHLSVLYRLGYDEIRIEFDDPSMVDKIQSEIEGMPGFEIVDQGENYCVIKNISTGLEKEFDNILRKIFLNIQYCGEQSLQFIKQSQFSKLESLKQMHRVNNRLPNFCERMLKKEGYKDFRKTILVYEMVCGMEQIGDYYNNIFVQLLGQTEKKKEPKLSKEVLELYERTNKIFESYYKLFYSFDADKLSDLKEHCLDNINKTKELIEKKNDLDANILLNLNLINERIYHMTESLI